MVGFPGANFELCKDQWGLVSVKNPKTKVNRISGTQKGKFLGPFEGKQFNNLQM